MVAMEAVLGSNREQNYYLGILPFLVAILIVIFPANRFKRFGWPSLPLVPSRFLTTRFPSWLFSIAFLFQAWMYISLTSI